MKISKEARHFARELFQGSLSNGRLDASACSQLTDRLLAAKPRGYTQVLHEYTRLIRLELERRHALVESAVPLDAAHQAELKKDLLARFGDDITIEFQTNPALLGGLRIKVGSDVWDGSVSARLEALSKQL